MSDHGLRRFFLVVVLMLAVRSPALAEASMRPRSVVQVCSAPAAIIIADSRSLSKFLVGGGRTRVVQVCVVAMCIALFIMMRKLN